MPILIFYGSNHGTCKDFANKLAVDAKNNNFIPKVIPLEELTLTYDFSGLLSKATKTKMIKSEKADTGKRERASPPFSVNSTFLPCYFSSEDTMVTALVVCCSYSGKPPDNAKKFFNWMCNVAKPGVMNVLQYAIFGVSIVLPEWSKSP